MTMVDDDLILKIENSGLSKRDKAAFFMCLKCEWLVKVDYENLRLYCSKQSCVKGGN